ncbi:MAG: PQQ-dependent sugar dehydrogenase [Bradymonadaceae bacterium]|nr:PQQ-dependent sugar dehydrogenase [Lujinxingiaceae bacterium]
MAQAWSFDTGSRVDASPAADGERVWSSAENGDDVNDEVNLITAGANYGWPLIEGHCDNYPRHEPCERADEFISPVHEFRTIVGPTGVLVYSGKMMPQYTGNVFVSGWHSARIDRFVWNPDTGRLDYKGEFFSVPGGSSGFTDIIEASDGAILALESGTEAGTIYRIAPTDRIIDPDRVIDREPGAEAPGPGCATTPAKPSLALVVLGLIATIAFARSRPRARR